MQLASHGARLVARRLPPSSSRNIHIPSFARAPSGSPTPGTVHRIIQQSRTLLTHFFTHLTTPGTVHRSSAPLLTRPLNGAARGHTSIRNGLSFPVRTALSRPLQAPFLPRAPAIPRGMTQVGLGTTRNFSSTRPIFQNLVQNVPIAGRAFWEADWEIKIQKEREGLQKPVRRKSKKSHEKKILQDNFSSPTKTTYDVEMEHYFHAARVPNVTTCLLIPLAPTPTTRVPLPSSPPDHRQSLLPLPQLMSLHAEHVTHSLRVSSLFARLDAAKVWNRGVTYSAYSHGSAARSSEGICTILKLEFAGWTKAEVRGVIGESGTGWCILEENRTGQEDEQGMDDETSSIFSGMSSELDSGDNDSNKGINSVIEDMDPAQSFILPTLDFSSSFVAATSSPSLTTSGTGIFPHNQAELEPFPHSDWDWDSNSGSESDNTSCIVGLGVRQPFLETRAGSASALNFRPEQLHKMAQEKALSKV